MKKILYIACVSVMSLCVGCKSEQQEITARVTSAVPNVQKQEENIQLTETDFYDFFEHYFSLSEEEILSLNKNYLLVDSAYWQNLGNYKQGILNKIGVYLSEDVKQKLDQQYLNDTIQLPKKIRVNEYVTYGSGKLEKIEVISTRFMGEDVVYEVAATTSNPVQSLSVFEENYEWCTEKGYYDLKKNALGQKKSILQDSEEVPDPNDYIYAVAATDEHKDEIKLIQRYWVTAAPEKTLKIKSIQEAQPIKIQDNERAKVMSNQYVTRIAYKMAPNAKESLLIEKIFGQMMGYSKEDFKQYHQALVSGYEATQLFWEGKGLLEEMHLEPESYTNNFSDTLSPYKDNIVDLTFVPSMIEITPSIYSTKMQMRFIVSLPIKALLSNNEIVYYKYKYFVGMDGDKLEFIEFMNMELLTKENYNISMSNVGRH